ncbi:MAG: metallophosphoesterase [Phycisphaerales bacterium]|nr:metallophosphoesterase [Phycisphaerales bacterium]
MRLLITADLHYNHPRSQALARQLIEQINALQPDALLVVGDTAVADGDALETCLKLFDLPGPKLFLAGNHELWTHGPDSYALFTHELPQRVQALGWHWLETQPFHLTDQVAVVGSVGWYDYSMAAAQLKIPLRFYQAKISPGAAVRFSQFKYLLDDPEPVPPSALEIIARWNDGKFVKLGRSDPQFLTERLASLTRQLDELRSTPRVIAAVHHVPFLELTPPRHGDQWDFARAYLGSVRLGELLLRYPNISHIFCGHSHVPAEAHFGTVHAINIGSGYRNKTFRLLDI